MNPQTYHCSMCELDVSDPVSHVSSDEHKAVVQSLTPQSPPITTEAVTLDPAIEAARAALATPEPTPQPVVAETPGHAGAPEGNTNAEKFKTPEERAELLQAFVNHMSQGYSRASFRPCDMKTFQYYRERYPIEFPTEIIEAAERDGMYFWENIGRNGTIGLPIKIKNAKGETIEVAGKYNSDSWKFNMQNRFKWKINTDVTTDGEKLPSPAVIIDTKESS